MRKTWLAPVLLAVTLVFQFTVVNGLHLPKGGVPDLVLVLFVALAVAEGPVPAMVTGFATGLCLDIAPPGTGLIGQYALVFCLAGWAAGSLGRITRRAPLRTLALVAVVVAGAESMIAALGKLLEPAQVSVAEIRHFLPVTIAYDLLICPFALYLVMLTGSTVASSRLAGSGMAGAGLLGGPGRSKRAARQRRPHEPRLDPAAARAGDGWVGGGPLAHPGILRPAGRTTRLHPGAGVAGSASGYRWHRSLPARPVNLRLSSRRRRDGGAGSVLGSGKGQYGKPGRHPGLLAGAGRQLRFGGELGGSAARQHPAPGLRLARRRINFGAHPGINSVGRGGGSGWRTTPSRGGAAAPRLRMGSSRSALAVAGRQRPVSSVPTLHFRAAPAPIARRPAAAPKFRRRSRLLRPAALTSGLVAGGALDQMTLTARRRAVGPPRLRLGRSNATGMLGGSGRSPLRRAPVRPRKQPRFGYGHRSPLSFLTGRRVGGRWLASKRVGRRSGVWLLGRREGGQR